MRKISLISLLILILCGCTVKELDTVSDREMPASIRISMPASIDTKLTLGEENNERLSQVWQKGDCIAVVEGLGTIDQKVSVYELYGNGGAADGVFVYQQGYADPEGVVDIIYPASAMDSDIPQFQTYIPGSYDPSAVRLSWKGDGIPVQGVTLSNEMAIIGLQFEGESNQKVSSVNIKIFSSETDYKEYRLSSYEGVTLSPEPTTFYISIPEISQKCSVEFRTVLTDRSVMTMTSDEKSFISGNYYRFPAIPFIADDSGNSSFIDNLRPHPRLLLPAGHESKIKEILTLPQSDFLRRIHDEIETRSNRLLNQAPYIRDGLSNVNYPREILGRVLYLSYMYRMTENEEYARRAEEELLASSINYDDWRPNHFLTTSEMTLAFAIGYDWLYDYLPESSKEIFVDEIVNKGIDLSYTSYGNSYKQRDGNWNSVCSSCMIASALAIFEQNPEKYAEFVETSLTHNLKAVEAFGPDGGYPEGYSYWHYGTSYQTILFEVLKTAVGYDSPLPDATAGFDKTGAYPMMMSTPTGGCFSYSDVAIEADVSSASFWLARHFDSPEWLYLDRKRILSDDFEQKDMLWRFNPLILSFSVGLDIESINRPSENIWYSGGDQPLFAYRSGFDNENDIYLAIKGGYPAENHAHMDSGSFYYERDGIIWADDLGSDSYTLSNYWASGQDGGRWEIFRLGLSAHNTISFDEAYHIVTAKAAITEHFTEEKVGAVVDLTSSCANKVSKAERTVYLEGSVLNIKDDVIPLSSTVLKWNMITPTNAVSDGPRRILLSSGDKTMALEVISPDHISTFIIPAEGGEGNLPNPDHSCIGFTASLEAGKEYVIHVTLTPVD